MSLPAASKNLNLFLVGQMAAARYVGSRRPQYKIRGAGPIALPWRWVPPSPYGDDTPAWGGGTPTESTILDALALIICQSIICIVKNTHNMLEDWFLRVLCTSSEFLPAFREYSADYFIRGHTDLSLIHI